MKAFYLLLFVLVIPLSSWAQNTSQDLKLFEKGNKYLEKARQTYLENQVDKSEKYFEKAFNIFQSISDLELKARSYHRYGRYYEDKAQPNFDLAIHHYRLARDLSLAKKDYYQQEVLNCLKFSIQQSLGRDQINEAIIYANQLIQEVPSPDHYCWRGEIYEKWQKREKAIQDYLKGNCDEKELLCQDYYSKRFAEYEKALATFAQLADTLKLKNLINEIRVMRDCKTKRDALLERCYQALGRAYQSQGKQAQPSPIQNNLTYSGVKTPNASALIREKKEIESRYQLMLNKYNELINNKRGGNQTDASKLKAELISLEAKNRDLHEAIRQLMNNDYQRNKKRAESEILADYEQFPPDLDQHDIPYQFGYSRRLMALNELNREEAYRDLASQVEKKPNATSKELRQLQSYVDYLGQKQKELKENKIQDRRVIENLDEEKKRVKKIIKVRSSPFFRITESLGRNFLGLLLGLSLVLLIAFMGFWIFKQSKLQKKQDEELQKVKKELKDTDDLLEDTTMDLLSKGEVQKSQEKKIEEQKNLLAAAQYRLEDLQTSRSQWFSKIIRDIKNPLRLILQKSQIYTYENVNSYTQEKLDDIHKSARRINTYTNEQLALQDISQTPLPLQLSSHNLSQTVQSAIDSLTPFIKEKNLNVYNQVPSQLFGRYDASYIERVFINILSHAIEYSTTGGAIHLEARAQGGDLLIGIRDNGVRISELDYHNIFLESNPGEKPRSAEDRGANHLGLFYAKKVIEAHKKDIQVQSKAEKGVTFHFQLPLSQETISEAQQEDLKEQKQELANQIPLSEEDKAQLAPYIQEIEQIPSYNINALTLAISHIETGNKENIQNWKQIGLEALVKGQRKKFALLIEMAKADSNS